MLYLCFEHFYAYSVFKFKLKYITVNANDN